MPDPFVTLDIQDATIEDVSWGRREVSILANIGTEQEPRGIRLVLPLTVAQVQAVAERIGKKVRVTVILED